MIFVGLDVHKETIGIAITRGGWGSIEDRGKIANTPEALWKQLRRLGAKKQLSTGDFHPPEFAHAGHTHRWASRDPGRPIMTRASPPAPYPPTRRPS